MAQKPSKPLLTAHELQRLVAEQLAPKGRDPNEQRDWIAAFAPRTNSKAPSDA